MSEPAATPSPEPLDPREARAAKRLRALERLTVIGMALSEALLARVSDAMNSGEAVDSAAVALEFSRLSRAVRQTVALEAKLDVEIDLLAQKITAERAAKQAEDERRRNTRINFRADCVHTAIGQAIEAETTRTGDEERAERLDEQLRERLEDPREDDVIADLPVSALIERICKTLGVAVDWDLWKNEDWAVEEWREGVPGSPYAAASGQPNGLCETSGSPSGEADREAGGGGFHATPARSPGPLHRLSGGPPPPTGEELGGGATVSVDVRPP
jgi:hypothetical protein